MTATTAGTPTVVGTHTARAARTRRRRPWVVVGLLVAVPICALAALQFGSSDMTPVETLAALVGAGDDGAVFVVRVLRLPRVLVAVCAGAGLGASGMLMQGLLRNPLGSPDVMGVTAGAGLAAVLAIGAAVPPLGIPVAAALGAGVATTTLHLVTRRCGTRSARLVLAGIGIHAAASAATSLAVARVSIERLGAVEVWLAGSLHARNSTHVLSIVIALGVALPVALALVRRLGVLELGDEVAVGAGVPVAATRTQLLVVATVLAGAAVAVTGPIGFVALGAPHIARRIVGHAGAAGLVTAGLVGGLLLLVADVVGQWVLHPTSIAAGVVTAVLGAPYLLWLLHQWGRR